MWTRRYDGPAHEDDEAKSVTADASGNVLVTGYAKPTGSWQQCTTIKYGPDGQILWVAGFERNGEHSAGEAIAVDSVGCAFVAGGVAPAGQYSDYLTVKYNPNGETLWTGSYNGPGNSADYCNAIALGRDGSVYVTGGSQSDILTIKYVQNGGVEETPNADIRTSNANIVVRGVLLLPEDSDHKPQATSWLLDISGRKVLDLHPGANDVRALAPGVYFVREPSAVAVRKVVITG
jgi:hypothetical protein